MRTYRLWIAVIALMLPGLALAESGATDRGATGSDDRTIITYQGQLHDADGAFNGALDMEFRLFDSVQDGVSVGIAQSIPSVPVTDGLFQVELDFGNVYSVGALFLEVTVDGQTLEPRQPVTSAPVAVHALSLDSAFAADRLWQLGGNAGTSPNSDYLGTTDAVPFEVHVEGNRAIRIEPATMGRPNIIGGWMGNEVVDGAIGATIGGGGEDSWPNKVLDSFGTISGGRGNAAGRWATIGGGDTHSADGNYATVAGGRLNQSLATDATIGGGNQNKANGDLATIAGGALNTAEAYSTAVGGGIKNTASGLFAAVPGGRVNTAAGDYSFAAGHRAKANHDGAFVWADSTDADFASGGADQFLVRAGGGVGINTNSPTAPLSLQSENNWDLTSTEGDFNVGDGTHRFKLGVSLGGGGAGNVRMRAQGGTNNLILGSNESDVMRINDVNGVEPGTDDDFSLGSNDRRWSAVYAVNGTIQTSDRRLKRDIRPLGGGLEVIRALRPVTYRWKRDADDGARPGLIAQEVREVVPEVVVEPENESGPLGIRYAELIPILISAVKEQNRERAEQISRLEAENAELKARLAALEALVLQDREVTKAGSSNPLPRPKSE